SSLTLDHWSDPDGSRPALGTFDVDEGELLEPEALVGVEPEEEFEGYTGNAGMTLDRWYRHAAIVIWPNRRHFEILCHAGTATAGAGLAQWVQRWRQAGPNEEPALRKECIDFAAAIMERWPENTYGHAFAGRAEPDNLLRSLEAIGEPGLVKA